MRRGILFILFFVVIFPVHQGETEDGSILFRDDFHMLDNWKPLHFPKISEHTNYSIENEGSTALLKVESNASASGIVYKREFNVFEFSKVRWRWKVSNVFKKGNAREKSGDDYPLRMYIIFKYDPENATFGQKIKYGLAKQIYGEYPPHSSINYIWANRHHDEHIIPNAYASEAKMIILQSGTEKVGQWVDEGINIIEDYHRAFGEDPPSFASLAIMSDTDNTKESAVSYIDYIEVYR